MSNLVIYTYPLGPMDNFVYILGNTDTHEYVIVDPAWDGEFLLSEITKRHGVLVAILLTHGHHDHTNALVDVLKGSEGIPVYLSDQELPELTPDGCFLRPIKDNDDLLVAGHSIHCLHTPGHTPGGVCYQVGDCLITGDTLFIDGCGRADLSGSDPDKLYDSLEKLKLLSENLVVYPGHDYGDTPTDTLGHQKQTNRFLTARDREHFLRLRMGTA